MRVAVIDIGSNTVHLLIADTDGAVLRPLADPSRALFIGQDVVKSGTVKPARVKRVIDTVREFADRATSQGAIRIMALATEAVRRASNGDVILSEIAAHGITVERISARREGELASVGASIDSPTRGNAVLADIGGASTQLVSIVGGVPVAVHSVPLGSGTLAAVTPGDPPGIVSVSRLGGTIGPLLDQAIGMLPESNHSTRLIGVGGTIRRLGRLAGNSLLPSEPSRTALSEIVEALFQAPSKIVSKRLDLDAQRISTLRVGGLVLIGLLERLPSARLRVSTAGIREGAALLLAQGLNPAVEGLFPV